MRAYAIKTPEGGIDIRSVFPTERGAKVNWLHLHIMSIHAGMSDDTIDALFEINYADATLVEVEITEVKETVQ
jgi:hypothetical protein